MGKPFSFRIRGSSSILLDMRYFPKGFSQGATFQVCPSRSAWPPGDQAPALGPLHDLAEALGPLTCYSRSARPPPIESLRRLGRPNLGQIAHLGKYLSLYIGFGPKKENQNTKLSSLLRDGKGG